MPRWSIRASPTASCPALPQDEVMRLEGDRPFKPMKEDTMPRFYINFLNGDQIAKDDVGQDLPGLEEAKAAALVSAREILADNIKGGATNPLRAVLITNE